MYKNLKNVFKHPLPFPDTAKISTFITDCVMKVLICFKALSQL